MPKCLLTLLYVGGGIIVPADKLAKIGRKIGNFDGPHTRNKVFHLIGFVLLDKLKLVHDNVIQMCHSIYMGNLMQSR